MRRLVIAIDCDDVLMPSSEAIVAHYNQEYGTNVHVDDFYERNPGQWGVQSLEEVYDRIRMYFHSPQFKAEVKPYAEAVDAVKRLARRHELHLVTGRGSNVEAVTQAMVDEHFTSLFVSMEHTGSYKQPDGTFIRRTKGEVCKAINADILIDDNLDHARSVIEHGIDTVLLFGTNAWTDKEKLAGAIRCQGWSDVLSEIGTLEREAGR